MGGLYRKYMQQEMAKKAAANPTSQINSQNYASEYPLADKESAVKRQVGRPMKKE